MEGLTSNGEFDNVLEGMMEQLMSKEMLYEPMKDLIEKVRRQRQCIWNESRMANTRPLVPRMAKGKPE